MPGPKNLLFIQRQALSGIASSPNAAWLKVLMMPCERMWPSVTADGEAQRHDHEDLFPGVRKARYTRASLS
jgi:hypothetical protein